MAGMLSVEGSVRNVAGSWIVFWAAQICYTLQIQPYMTNSAIRDKFSHTYGCCGRRFCPLVHTLLILYLKKFTQNNNHLLFSLFSSFGWFCVLIVVSVLPKCQFLPQVFLLPCPEGGQKLPEIGRPAWRLPQQDFVKTCCLLPTGLETWDCQLQVTFHKVISIFVVYLFQKCHAIKTHCSCYIAKETECSSKAGMHLQNQNMA